MESGGTELVQGASPPSKEKQKKKEQECVYGCSTVELSRRVQTRVVYRRDRSTAVLINLRMRTHACTCRSLVWGCRNSCARFFFFFTSTVSRGDALKVTKGSMQLDSSAHEKQ